MSCRCGKEIKDPYTWIDPSTGIIRRFCSQECLLIEYKAQICEKSEGGREPVSEHQDEAQGSLGKQGSLVEGANPSLPTHSEIATNPSKEDEK